MSTWHSHIHKVIVSVVRCENGSNIVPLFSYSTLFFIIYINYMIKYRTSGSNKILYIWQFKTANTQPIRMLSMHCDHIGMYYPA
jgi:hypothetical protein